VSASKPGRLGYLDWLRGLSVLIMIEAHTFDAWTLPAERTRPAFGRLMLLAGMAAPLFLFLAGVAVALATAAQARRGRSRQDAARRVERRGWQIFGYAFLFRLQSFVLGGLASPGSLLKVDILNVMGPAIAVTAAVWGLAARRWTKAALLIGATLALISLTPWLRGLPLLSLLPDPVEWYLKPPPGQGTFTLLPWAGFVLAGGVLGVALDGASASGWWRPWRLQAVIGLSGLALTGVSVWAASRPALLPDASFWTTSPAFFGLRTGLMVALVAASWLWAVRPWRRTERESPMEVLGVGSLFVYWVHVELVYGFAGRPLRHQLTLEQCAVAWTGFSLAMYALLLGWNASRPTRLWLRDELLKLIKSDSWTQNELTDHQARSGKLTSSGPGFSFNLLSPVEIGRVRPIQCRTFEREAQPRRAGCRSSGILISP
jgi:uncharacterized membrane protein